MTDQSNQDASSPLSVATETFTRIGELAIAIADGYGQAFSEFGDSVNKALKRDADATQRDVTK